MCCWRKKNWGNVPIKNSEPVYFGCVKNADITLCKLARPLSKLTSYDCSLLNPSHGYSDIYWETERKKLDILNFLIFSTLEQPQAVCGLQVQLIANEMLYKYPLVSNSPDNPLIYCQYVQKHVWDLSNKMKSNSFYTKSEQHHDKCLFCTPETWLLCKTWQQTHFLWLFSLKISL